MIHVSRYINHPVIHTMPVLITLYFSVLKSMLESLSDSRCNHCRSLSCDYIENGCVKMFIQAVFICMYINLFVCTVQWIVSLTAETDADRR
jgi:hypothetical protein